MTYKNTMTNGEFILANPVPIETVNKFIGKEFGEILTQCPLFWFQKANLFSLYIDKKFKTVYFLFTYFGHYIHHKAIFKKYFWFFFCFDICVHVCQNIKKKKWKKQSMKIMLKFWSNKMKTKSRNNLFFLLCLRRYIGCFFLLWIMINAVNIMKIFNFWFTSDVAYLSSVRIFCSMASNCWTFFKGNPKL